MKNTVFKILCAVLAIPMVAACYSLEDEQYAELSPITFNDVSSTIDVMAGDELVYDKLEVTSEFPVTYEWAYGPKKTTAATSEYDMQSLEVISDKPDIQYTFTRIGQYILRLKVDNGESIEFKYFTLNVNSAFVNILLVANVNGEWHNFKTNSRAFKVIFIYIRTTIHNDLIFHLLTPFLTFFLDFLYFFDFFLNFYDFFLNFYDFS